MRYAITILIMMFLLAASSSSVASQVIEEDSVDYNFIAGTEKPALDKTEKCFVFSSYVVKTVENEDTREKVAVYKRVASAAAESACQTTGQAILEVSAPTDDRGTTDIIFYGLSGQLLFIDKHGSWQDFLDLQIYDLNTRKLIFHEPHRGTPPKLVDEKFIVLDSPSDKKGAITTCKEAAQWKREGKEIGWAQTKKLDLQTMTSTNVGVLRCVSL